MRFLLALRSLSAVIVGSLSVGGIDEGEGLASAEFLIPYRDSPGEYGDYNRRRLWRGWWRCFCTHCPVMIAQ